MQQQPMQQSQQPLHQPPQAISVKDQLYLSDMLNWNLNAAKKCAFFAKQCSDTEIKQELDKTARMHEKHYQRLLTHFQSHSPLNQTTSN
ncbi:hypothetical protein [Alteribacillus iranensis]|uniref:Coat F domain-containing protein n=1 Tax=Alteribacillus iranensis TaxID=930128 RepID=A0A1I2FHS4_9BACI|nr:hypothetical protein [Alteribacillus iranensis]SFF04308.1 hypothetical protein SAMN05192532_1124 [Alteribacillus iranensis]